MTPQERDLIADLFRRLDTVADGEIDTEARAFIERQVSERPHALYMLAQTALVQEHALKGHEWAWANGPPYVFHWRLEECRAVLRALNVPEPEHPPFDPARHPPFPWEADIHRMLEEHARKKQEKALA